MAPSIMSVSILYVYVLLRILRDGGAEADTGEAASIVAHLMPVSPRQLDTASTDSTPMPPTINKNVGICCLYLVISLFVRVLIWDDLWRPLLVWPARGELSPSRMSDVLTKNKPRHLVLAGIFKLRLHCALLLQEARKPRTRPRNAVLK